MARELNHFPCWKLQPLAIQQNKETAKDVQVAVAIAMAKDVLVSYCPIYFLEFQEVFNPSASYQSYSIMLSTSAPKFAKRGSKKRSKSILGWIYTFLKEAGLAEQLAIFEEKILGKLRTQNLA